MPSDRAAPPFASPPRRRLRRGRELLLGLALVCACAPKEEEEPKLDAPVAPAGERDLLLVTVRGLRADLFAAGCDDGSLPALAALRERGEEWTRCFVPSVESAASLASVLTGKFPWEHGLRLGLATSLPEAEETLFERANTIGVPSTAVLCDLRLGPSSGLCQGVGEIDPPIASELRWAVIGENAEAIEGRRSLAETVDAARQRVAAMAADGRSSILWLALELFAFDSPADTRDQLRRTYADQLAALSSAVGTLREAFESTDPRRQATVVLCGTCGTLLGEDERYATERSLDQVAVHVPCLLAPLHDRSAARTTIRTDRSLVDLGPRLRRLLGLEEARTESAAVRFESLRGSFEAGRAPLFGGIDAGHRWDFADVAASEESHADSIAAWSTGAFALAPLESPRLDERLVALRTVGTRGAFVERAVVPALERYLAWDGPARGLLVPAEVDPESFLALDDADGRALELWLAATLGDLVRRERLREDVRAVLGPRADQVLAAAEALPGSPLVAILAGLPTLAPFRALEDRLRLGRRARTLAPWSLNANRTLADALAKNGSSAASQAILESYLRNAPLGDEARADFERRLRGR